MFVKAIRCLPLFLLLCCAGCVNENSVNGETTFTYQMHVTYGFLFVAIIAGGGAALLYNPAPKAAVACLGVALLFGVILAPNNFLTTAVIRGDGFYLKNMCGLCVNDISYNNISSMTETVERKSGSRRSMGTTFYYLVLTLKSGKEVKLSMNDPLSQQAGEKIISECEARGITYIVPTEE